MDTSWGRVCTFDYKELIEILRERGFPIEDLKITNLKSWRCYRESYKGSDRCIFHAEEKDPKEFLKSFDKELERMEREDKVIDFRGFIFPAKFDLKSRVFDKPIFFTGATFTGPADFSDVTFLEDADFTGAEFQDEVEFNMSKFQKVVSFNDAIFEKHGIFNRTKFQDIA